MTESRPPRRAPRNPLHKNIMVAATHVHARAMLRWLKHDAAHWDVAAYGDALHRKYQFAQIVRPGDDVTEAQIDWILETLIPAVEKQITPVPLNWNIERAPRTEEPVDG